MVTEQTTESNSIQDSPGNRKFLKFLWNCAGADVELLDKHCPPSDHSKYAGLGGIVLGTGVLAALSAGYAFYTIFSPKGDAIDSTVFVGSIIGSILGGLLWGLMIFNLDRFIISSTGKGDEEESISRSELKNAFPRIIMALIIGFTMSKPLEIRIMQSEIDAELQSKQNAYLEKLNAETDTIINKKAVSWKIQLDKTEKELKEKQDYFELRRLELKDQMKALDDEAAGKTANSTVGMGPAYRSKKASLDKLEAERLQSVEASKPELARLQKNADIYREKVQNIESEREELKKVNIIRKNQLDGLLERILISHEIGPWVSFCITLLLLMIETGPIFFKLMMVKGAYDYLVENKKKIILAKSGIVEHPPHSVGNKAVVEYHYLQVEAMSDVAKKANESWTQQVNSDIKDNPEKFL
jgi:hypothetical protein